MTPRHLAALAAAALLLEGHSPYRQWYAYRAKHLIVVTDEPRPGALATASAVAAAMAAALPETKAVPAGATSAAEVVKLLASGQLQVGLIPAADARNALEGRGGTADLGKTPVRSIVTIGGDVLIVLEGFAKESACSIAQALVRSTLHARVPRDAAPVPLHAGLNDCAGT